MSDWLDTAAPAAPADQSWLATDGASPKIEDPNAGKITRAFQHLIDACMRGTGRVMACDGHFLAYRPYNREFDKEVNPRTQQRFSDFQAAGHYKHVGTYGEIQVYELLEGSPFKHAKRDYVVGRNYWSDVRLAARAAVAREWSDYHDIMGACATAMKSDPDRDPGFARAQFNDFVTHVGVTIGQMKGPPLAEVNAAFARIRQKRGISKASPIELNTAIDKYSARG